MQIDRLIGILLIFLQEDKTTAPELAERFEVSRRTINRDIEDLARPVFLFVQFRALAAGSVLWTDTGWTGRS